MAQVLSKYNVEKAIGKLSNDKSWGNHFGNGKIWPNEICH